MVDLGVALSQAAIPGERFTAADCALVRDMLGPGSDGTWFHRRVFLDQTLAALRASTDGLPRGIRGPSVDWIVRNYRPLALLGCGTRL